MIAETPVALAGLGRLGTFHLHNLVRHIPEAKVVAVYDVDPARAEAVSRAYSLPAADSFTELCESTTAEGILIATSTSSHADLICQALAAGKHVFTEKPIALTLADTGRTLAAAHASDTVLQVGFHRRFDTDFREAKVVLDQGGLGLPLLMRLSHRDMIAPEPGTYIQHDGNLLIDSTIHDFDTALWLCGPVTSLTTTTTSVTDPRFAALGDADNAVTVLRFASGALGVIDNSRCAHYGYECSLELLGSSATIRIANDAPRLTTFTPGSSHAALIRDHTERHTPAYVAELRSFVAAVATGRNEGAGPHDALQAFFLSLAALEAQSTGRAVAVDDFVRTTITKAPDLYGNLTSWT